jgi:hypothetical protein
MPVAAKNRARNAIQPRNQRFAAAADNSRLGGEVGSRATLGVLKEDAG